MDWRKTLNQIHLKEGPSIYNPTKTIYRQKRKATNFGEIKIGYPEESKRRVFT